ncbi:hypothetical protein CAPTEDRAFT_224097 [Capitella teleta]|uniref:Uncharacterized protein n=1 Tax=Capitella teleta TaxID=283909 RepID=R7U633_CAPTE|nr:hypothetical protein CAPTEDRAFT_224097 [Capitella teleta]|eukprot:ELU01556.1 hypothetical protein CAPTEDRAFT_224097 [Capitella teleta]
MDAEGSASTASSSAKKLKQARLPFQILASKSTPPDSSNVEVEPKKRKLSDGATGPLKPPKTPKSSEKVAKKIDLTENEVSSSSEAEHSVIVIDENISPVKPKTDIIGLMDKFVTPTQKAEVSTSCSEDIADSVSDEEKKDEGEEMEEAETGKSPPRNSSQRSCSVLLSPLTPKIAKLEEELSVNLSTPVGCKRARPKTPVSSKEKEELRQKKKEEKEKLKAEKQRLKEEKERQRIEEKEKREAEKREAKEKKEKERLEKEREKQEKEKERQEKLEQIQKEKEEKLKAKEEERRKKQEVIEAKNEERKKKEEERVKDEEEKTMKKEKERAFFKQFFKKSEKSSSKLSEEASQHGPFMPFEVKKDMRIAPTVRIDFNNGDRLDKLMREQNLGQLYLNELKLSKRRPIVGKTARTWPLDDDIEMIDVKVGQKMSTKLLQFCENHRPAYYGTWRKISRKLSARNPFAKDETIFDYEVESDDEWEEEEPGESLSNSEGEGEGDGEASDKEDEDGDDDGFFVPHGYLSEGEGAGSEEDEVSPEKLKARQVAKARAWEMEMGKSCEVLRPVCTGCCWWSPGEANDLRSNPNLELLTRFTVQLINQTAPIVLEDVKIEKQAEDVQRKGARLREVPTDALADLIRLVHGNRYGVPKLIREFREFWQTKMNSTESNEHFISKRQLDVKIRSIANYERATPTSKKYWLVKESVLEEHGLKDLPVPTAWQWTTRSSPKKADRNDDSITEEPQSVKKRTNFSMKKFAIVRDSPAFVSPPPIKPQEPVTPKTPVDTEAANCSKMKPVNLFTVAAASPLPKESPLQKMFNNLKQPKTDKDERLKSSDKLDVKQDGVGSEMGKPDSPVLGSSDCPMVID